jgi:hypothetical protein
MSMGSGWNSQDRVQWRALVLTVLILEVLLVNVGQASLISFPIYVTIKEQCAIIQDINMRHEGLTFSE